MFEFPRLDLPAGNMPNHQGTGRPSPHGERGITESPQESGTDVQYKLKIWKDINFIGID